MTSCAVGNDCEKLRKGLGSWEAGLGYPDPYYVSAATHRSSEVGLWMEQGFPVANRWQGPRLLGALPGTILGQALHNLYLVINARDCYILG